jgi:hypothetical protein
MVVLTARSLTARKGCKEREGEGGKNEDKANGGREKESKTILFTFKDNGKCDKYKHAFSVSIIKRDCSRQFYCRETRLKTHKYTKSDPVPVALNP